MEKITTALLFPEVINVLKYLKEKGYKQAVLSAMEEGFLSQIIKKKGIAHYFEKIAGIDNHYAFSKAFHAKKLMTQLETDPMLTYIIGDTIHDYEVAKELGCNIILIAQGHQSINRLMELDCQMLNNLSELKNLF